MKRVVLGIAVLVLALAPLAASPAHAGVALGLKGGLSLSHVNADLFSTENRTGFVGGAYAAFNLGPAIGVQPELLFVRKGAKLFSQNVSVGGVDLGDVHTTLDVDYVEIPVLLRLSLPTPGPVSVRLLAGPVADIKVSEKLSLGGLVSYSLSSNQVKNADYGIAAGGAVAVQSGGVRVVGEGRYTYGLTNISDLPFGGDVKNAAIYATLGLEFPILGH